MFLSAPASHLGVSERAESSVYGSGGGGQQQAASQRAWSHPAGTSMCVSVCVTEGWCVGKSQLSFGKR